jgi:hypothetical protein
MLVQKLLKLTLGSVFISYTAFAGELLNVGLRVNLKYESFGEACRLSELFRHFNISLEVLNGNVTRGQLTKVNISGSPQNSKLTDQELAGFDVRRDQNVSWIKSFKASPALTKKLLNTADGLGASDSCKPPGDLVYDDLENTYIDFGIEAVDHLLPVFIYSKPVFLRGHKPNGDPFLIELTLTQDRT